MLSVVGPGSARPKKLELEAQVHHICGLVYLNTLLKQGWGPPGGWRYYPRLRCFPLCSNIGQASHGFGTRRQERHPALESSKMLIPAKTVGVSLRKQFTENLYVYAGHSGSCASPNKELQAVKALSSSISMRL